MKRRDRLAIAATLSAVADYAAGTSWVSTSTSSSRPVFFRS